MLKRLLFGLGREYYWWNGIYTVFAYWRANILVMPYYLYGFISGNYSGIRIFDRVMASLNALIFSAYTTLVFAIFDSEFNQKELL